MLSTVRLYYNTGLTPGNCLDNLSKLDSLGFTYRDFPSIQILQDTGVFSIRIATNWSNVKEADYCRINSVGYWVIGMTMLNENVCELTLSQDYFTTIGLSNMTIIAGWCTRRCVTNDSLFSNIIDEPFEPAEEFTVDGMTEIGDRTSADGNYNVVLSNIDLLNLDNLAEAYTATSQGVGKLGYMLVPQLPTTQNVETQYACHPQGVADTERTTISMTAAYNPNNADITAAIAKVRSLGIESCIGASYALPVTWASATEENGRYTLLSDKWSPIPSEILPTFGSYHNNKVYSGQFQRYVCYSVCEGTSAEFRVEDIVNDSNYVTWLLFADVRYSGYPSCRPLFYRGKQNDSMFGAIKGSNWQQTPFMYTMGSSGYAIQIADAAREMSFQFPQRVINLGSTVASGVGTFGVGSLASMAGGSSSLVDTAGMASGITQNAFNAISQVQSLIDSFRSFYATSAKAFQNLKPELQFPQIPQMQDFLGNGFYELRYRLSNNDMTRFDNFLTQFGYAVSEPLTNACFTGRQNFNYVAATDVNIKCSAPLYLRNGAIKQIENGIRVWHTAPSQAAMTNNPIS